jgi:hypothetical protein
MPQVIAVGGVPIEDYARVGQAKLPGDTEQKSDKGLSLDKEIPGTSTFNKPEDDIREFDKSEPGSIYRKDSPDDTNKPQEGSPKDDSTGDGRDNEYKPNFGSPGGRPPDDPTVTDYPYRDDPKHNHYASAGPRFNGELPKWILQSFLLRQAHEAVVEPPMFVRTAATIDQITNRLEPAIVERGDACTVSVRRVDAGNLRWIFAVDCGNGPRLVRVKGARVGNIVRLVKMQLRMSCSCPAWRWQGPEYHAKREKYQDGPLQGTASTPDIRDPHRAHQVCKHVAAVMGHVRKWEVPLRKPEPGGEKE